MRKRRSCFQLITNLSSNCILYKDQNVQFIVVINRFEIENSGLQNAYLLSMIMARKTSIIVQTSRATLPGDC